VVTFYSFIKYKNGASNTLLIAHRYFELENVYSRIAEQFAEKFAEQ
jgi:hypothetical protein